MFPSQSLELTGHRSGLRSVLTLLATVGLLVLTLSVTGCGAKGPAANPYLQKPPTVVPDVVGSPQGNAAQTLADAGLGVGHVSTEQTSVAFPGNVVSQKPAAGATVPNGTAVSLVIAQASATGAPVRVPDVVGLDYKTAVPRLAALGLPYKALYDTTSARPQGTIVSQLPKAGLTVPKGTVVQVTISLSKVPNPSAPTTP